MGSPLPRERLFKIFSDSTTDAETKIRTALEAGTEHLSLPIGFLTEIDQDTQRIVHAVGDHPAIQSGDSCPLEDAYCRKTIETDSVLAIQNARRSEAISEAAIRTFDLGAYIGTKVVVNDETYGTVCFADHDERDEEFGPAETHFVESLADLCGNALERRAHGRQLDQREEIYRAVIESSFGLVFRIDTDGKFTFLSAAMENLLGYTPEEYVGEPFTKILPDEQTVELATDIYEQVLAGRFVEEEYFPLESRADGTVFVDLRVTPLYRGEVPQTERTPEDIVGAVGTAHEVTDRLRRERLIRVLNRVIRHNIRNDLNIINGYTELLRTKLPEADRGSAERILRTTDRLLDLTESARRLEEYESTLPVLQRMDLVTIVQRRANQINQRYPGATVEIEVPDSAIARTAPRFETALWELLDNAAKHAGEAPTVEVTVTTISDRAVVHVADDGPGLPDTERKVLATGEETPIAHGRGLGLWLVYWIIQTLHGDLNVLYADDGTCIEIRLPAEGQPDESDHPIEST